MPRRYSRRGHQPQWRGGAAWALLKQYYRAQHRLGALHHKKYPSGDAWLLTVLDRTAAKVTFGNRRTAVAHLVKQLRRQARAA